MEAWARTRWGSVGTQARPDILGLKFLLPVEIGNERSVATRPRFPGQGQPKGVCAPSVRYGPPDSGSPTCALSLLGFGSWALSPGASLCTSF